MWDGRSLRYRDGAIETPGGGSPDGRSRIILFIHGYNNDKEEAEHSYAALSLNLPEDHAYLREQIWKFFWPSYVERITGRSIDQSVSLSDRYSTAGTESNMLLSIPSYAPQVLKAPAVGRALGEYLYGLMSWSRVPTEIVIVAHSLGCRVALEALRQMLAKSDAASQRQRVPCLLLMAAAVPTFMVSEGTRLGEAATLAQASCVLHSEADVVLHAAFPGGQGAASTLLRLQQLVGPADADASTDEGWAPEAVGRYGNPTNVWLRRAGTSLGHSQYWNHPSTAVNVLRALGKTVANELTPRATEHVTWTLPAYPELPDWQNREWLRERHLAIRRPMG